MSNPNEMVMPFRRYAFLVYGIDCGKSQDPFAAEKRVRAWGNGASWFDLQALRQGA